MPHPILVTPLCPSPPPTHTHDQHRENHLVGLRPPRSVRDGRRAGRRVVPVRAARREERQALPAHGLGHEYASHWFDELVYWSFFLKRYSMRGMNGEKTAWGEKRKSV